MMLPVMDIKTWLVEMAVAACILAGAITALTSMVTVKIGFAMNE
jgi:hypothetical protein